MRAKRAMKKLAMKFMSLGCTMVTLKSETLLYMSTPQWLMELCNYFSWHLCRYPCHFPFLTIVFFPSRLRGVYGAGSGGVARGRRGKLVRQALRSLVIGRHHVHASLRVWNPDRQSDAKACADECS